MSDLQIYQHQANIFSGQKPKNWRSISGIKALFPAEKGSGSVSSDLAQTTNSDQTGKLNLTPLVIGIVGAIANSPYKNYLGDSF